MLISRSALSSIAFWLYVLCFATTPAASQDILVNSAARALREADQASADELYEQYLFVESVVALPQEFQESPPDAIMQTARVMDFFESTVAASFGSIVNEHVAEYAKIYDRSAADATKSNVAVEAISAPLEVMISPSPSTVLIGRPISAGKIWASGQLQERYYRKEALEKFRERLESDPEVLNAYEAALERNRESAGQLLNSLIALENEADEASDPTGSPNSGTRRLAEDVANVTSSEELETIADAVNRGDYGDDLDLEKAADFVASAEKFVETAQDVIVKAAQTQEIVQNLGFDIPEEISTAISIGSGLTSTATALLDQKYFSAAVSLTRLIGPKKPDPAQQRFAAIMKALGQINARLGRIEQTQRELLEINQRIEQKVDTLQWTMERGHQRLELSIQQSAESIIEQIRLVDDRALGRCAIASELASAVLFPAEPEEQVSLFDEPNSNALSSVVFGQFSDHREGVIQERLNYLAARLVDDLPICLSTLRDVLGGLQADRGIDLHLHLSVFERLKDQKTGEEQAVTGDLDALVETASAFRERIFTPQLEYLRRAIERNSTAARLDPNYRDTVLAFNALRAPVGVPGSANHELQLPTSEELSQLDRYFKGQIGRVIVAPLAAASVHDVARIVSDLHIVIGLQEAFTIRGRTQLSLEDASTENLEFALRLLLQSLQTLEILRAQQAVIDGRVLLSFLEADLVSGEEARWNEAASVLRGNAQVRENFIRYLLHKAYRSSEIDLVAYGIAVDSGDVGFLEGDLRITFPKELSVQVSCTDQPERTRCPSKSHYRGPISPFEITLSNNLIPDAETLAVKLPASWAMSSLSFQWTDTGIETNRLHRILQSEIAGYHVPTLFSDAKRLSTNSVSDGDIDAFEKAYNGLKLIRLGFDIGELSTQLNSR